MEFNHCSQKEKNKVNMQKQIKENILEILPK